MNAIQIRNLSKRYANGVQAIKDITFDVKEHSFTAFLGKTAQENQQRSTSYRRC
jgi:ABC-type multidrug transport system ATPase subunit